MARRARSLASGQAPISDSDRPQPRHQPVAASMRQTLVQGDAITRAAVTQIQRQRTTARRRRPYATTCRVDLRLGTGRAAR